MENKQEELIDVTDTAKSPVKKKTVKSKVVTVQKKEVVIQSETGMLIQMAMKQSDFDIDKFKLLLELKNQEEDRKCQKEFETAFSVMKSELPIIEKSMEAKDVNGKVMYNFAPLEDLQEACDPILSKHNFSYHWEESFIEATKSKRITFFLSGYGFTRSNYFDSAEIPSNKYANAIQTAGIQASFGKRYSFQSGLGLIVKGVDNDAIHLSFQDGVDYAEDIVWLKSCTNREDLLDVFKKIVEKLKKSNDTIGKGILTAIYTDLKKELK